MKQWTEEKSAKCSPLAQAQETTITELTVQGSFMQMLQVTYLTPWAGFFLKN
jgi:hypothetical protein